MSISDNVETFELRGFKNVPGETNWDLPKGTKVVDNRIDDPELYAEVSRETAEMIAELKAGQH